jgi:DNA helicase-2/ATP-dependent DNA helicase PcrA
VQPAADVVSGAAAGIDLDPAQRTAVTTPSTLVAVIAGAGSGKTRVLTSRIAHRIAIGTAAPQHTLALTFTREAAGELRRRLRRSGVRDAVEAGTFHGVALGLLRQRWADNDQRAPTVVPDRTRLLADVPGGVPVATLSTECEWAAARGIRPDRYVHAARDAGRRASPSPERIAAALAAYEELKRRRGVVDFDDLLAMLSRELDRDHAWADAVRWRFRHLLVDEAQDLNPLQYRLLEQLVGSRGDLYLVGDPAQAIYGFNGADPGFLVDVSDRMPGIEIIVLPVNHRSSPQIVAAGAAVLRVGGQPRPATASRLDGPPVRIVAADDETHEAALVARFAGSLDPGEVRTGKVAVLARTNQQLGRLSTALAAAGVPVAEQRLRAGSPLASAVTTATRLPSATRLREWAHDVLDGVDGDVDPAERDVAAVVLDYLREQPLGDGAGLRSWLASTRPFSDDAGGVELLTFHGAKGREWSTVVVTGVETGSVPHRSATTAAARAEEARLLHVAVTRAAERLVITWAGRRGGYRRQPSPLLAEVDTSELAVVAPPRDLVTAAPRDGAVERLITWREAAARAAMILPADLCTDADLHAIATANPASPAGLAEVTGLGKLTATRLFPGIRAALDG